jgi:peptidyl-tRNA hydrolase, PTH1 family
VAVEATTPLLAVGLGNPGSEYRRTRHNVGFMVIDALCLRLHIAMKPGRGEFWWGRGVIDTREIALLKPVTYMNHSGVAVAEALEMLGCAADDLLVISDDFALPLGRLRIRKRGSDGGHNGLASVIYQLQSDEFARLRCGIGQPDMSAGEESAAFVLAPFLPEEEEAVSDMVARAAEAIEVVCRSGIDTGMNTYNT